jgi:NADPH:quinone reductase-like Zn-dependent oxidoreductase
MTVIIRSAKLTTSAGQIFATVGTAEKRKFLEGQGILSDHIFSSRTADFEKLILEKTGGHGIDVILNSLSGELLEASWNVIAYGGTFVEIGKRDMYDGSRLSMEPFKRAASFRAVDLMLHRVVDFDSIARLVIPEAPNLCMTTLTELTTMQTSS